MIGSTFSGIGLLDLGLERAGLGAPAWQIEINPYRRQVLARHWPAAERYRDVRLFRPADTACPRPDVVCGGFPCQPHSVAGLRLGGADERHLWPALARILEEARPPIFVGENVPGLRTTELRGVLADLAALGFDVEWTCFSAGSIGAPHQRDRLWLVATHPDRVDVRQQPGWLCRSVGAAQARQHRRDRAVLAADADQVRRPAVGRRTEESGRAEPLGSGAPDDATHTAQERRRARRQRKAPRRDGGRDEVDGLREATYTDGEGRVQRAIRIAEERGWARYCGWQLDRAARVDDGSAAGLERPWRDDADELHHVGERKAALGDGVVVACAELVGRAVMEAIGA